MEHPFIPSSNDNQICNQEIPEVVKTEFWLGAVSVVGNFHNWKLYGTCLSLIILILKRKNLLLNSSINTLVYILNAFPTAVYIRVATGPNPLTDKTVCNQEDGDGDEEECNTEHDGIVGVLQPTAPWSWTHLNLF